MCKQRLKVIKLKKTDPWSMSDLEEAVKYLGRDKSRDAMSFAKELFKEQAAGTDFKICPTEINEPY